jgi:hypothetical protein
MVPVAVKIKCGVCPSTNTTAKYECNAHTVPIVWYKPAYGPKPDGQPFPDPCPVGGHVNCPAVSVKCDLNHVTNY